MRIQAQPSSIHPWLILLALSLLLPTLAWADDDDEATRFELLFPQQLQVQCDGDEADCAKYLLRSLTGGGFLGVETTSMTAELRTFFKAPEDSGLLVGKVQSDSAAERAGLRVGDVITAVDGEPVKSSSGLARLIRRKQGGDNVEIAYVREGRADSTSAELAERSGHPLALDMSGIFERLETVRALPNIEVSRELMEKAMSEASRALEEQNLGERLRYFKEVEASGLEERMGELQERLRELEARIELELEDRLHEMENHHDDI